MGVYKRPDSPFYWLLLEGHGREPTKIRHDAAIPRQRKHNERLAQELYHRRMADVAQDAHGLPKQRPPIRFLTFRRWYAEHRTALKRSATRERSALNKMGEFFDDYQLHQIDKQLVQAWMAKRAEAVKPSTVNRELDVLKDLMNAAVPKHLERSPILGLTRLRARSRKPRPLTRDEEQRLLKVVDAEDAALIVLALDSLMRLSDLVNLQWRQVFPGHIEVEDPKEEPYQATLSTRARTRLQQLRATSSTPWVFPKHHRKKHHYGATAQRRGRANRPNVGDRSPQSSVARMFRLACLRAGVPHGRKANGVTFHSMRGTGATRLFRAGADPRSVMAVGGWSDIRSVMRYASPSDDLRALVDRATAENPPPPPLMGDDDGPD